MQARTGRSSDRALQAVAAATALPAGSDFFPSVARLIGEQLGAGRAWIGRYDPPERIHVIGGWSASGTIDAPGYALAGAPCEQVLQGADSRYVPQVHGRFPDFALAAGCAAYLATPLVASDGIVLGIAAVAFETAVEEVEEAITLLRILSARAAAELDRLRIEDSLRASEERFRDIFDEAPIAYVIEDLDTRFIRANRTAMRTLGITPEQVHGTVGLSFIPDTPEAQQRVRDALASVNRGTDTSGVILELRRRDDGKPLWIQWWSRPEPGGAYTRTMFIDITDKILMEQEQARLRAQNLYLQEEIKSAHNFEEIVGRSPGLARVLEDVSRVAPTDATVLILGETGTGKELIARAIHSRSRRADRPFIKINCAALPAALIESELFGHERGAFSGAVQRRIGRFELANTGTIFLDEIGEMPLDVQAKLLRVLQEQEFERVGSSHTLRTDVRVVAATNRDLATAIGDGSFREDLFYRLHVFPVSLPPLRERTEDIPLLLRYFIDKYSPRVGRSIDRIAAGVIEQLQGYPWPGNIRELENLVERALILATGCEFDVPPTMLPTTIAVAPARAGMTTHRAATAPAPVAPPALTSPEVAAGDLNSVQREHILHTLEATHWVIEGERGAARRLGIKPATLRHRMKKLGISRQGESRA